MKSLPSRWLSVDPGLSYTGWALWHRERLAEWGLITGRDVHTTDWKLKASIQASRTWQVMRRHDVCSVLSEVPQEMGHATGRAALNSGSVRKLAYYVGVLAGYAAHAGIEFNSVEPSVWKGTLPKEITQKRVLRAYPQVPSDLRSDVFDAIGIGRFRLRKNPAE